MEWKGVWGRRRVKGGGAEVEGDGVGRVEGELVSIQCLASPVCDIGKIGTHGS